MHDNRFKALSEMVDTGYILSPQTQREVMREFNKSRQKNQRLKQVINDIKDEIDRQSRVELPPSLVGYDYASSSVLRVCHKYLLEIISESEPQLCEPVKNRTNVDKNSRLINELNKLVESLRRGSEISNELDSPDHSFLQERFARSIEKIVEKEYSAQQSGK